MKNPAISFSKIEDRAGFYFKMV